MPAPCGTSAYCARQQPKARSPTPIRLGQLADSQQDRDITVRRLTPDAHNRVRRTWVWPRSGGGGVGSHPPRTALPDLTVSQPLSSTMMNRCMSPSGSNVPGVISTLDGLAWSAWPEL